MGTTSKAIVINHDITGVKFEKTSITGAKEFGAMWIEANRAAIEAAIPMTEYYDPAMKELMSKMTLNILRRLRNIGAIR